MLFGLALAVFGLVGLVYVFDGEQTYRDLVVADSPRELVIPLGTGGTWHVSREMLVDIHRATLAYVLGVAGTLPLGPDRSPLYSADESAHLADVRALLSAVRMAWVVAALVLVALLLRARIRRSVPALVRDGVLVAAALVLAVAIGAAVAFEPLFLAFHHLFFPQGNFLFDPATSGLLLVYPERYWYGVTIRIGVTFVLCAGLLAAIATAALRWQRAD